MLLPILLALATAVPAAATGTDPLYEQRPWNGFTAIVMQWYDESPSVGTYTVRVYSEPLAGELLDHRLVERNGSLRQVWIDDVDGDERDDLVIWVESGGSGSYGVVHVYGLTEAGRITTLEMPDDRPHDRYRGHDAYDVVDGVLYREFPLYRDGDPNADPTGGRAKLRYDPRAEEWVPAAGAGDRP